MVFSTLHLVVFPLYQNSKYYSSTSNITTDSETLRSVPWFGAEADSDANGQYGSFTMTSESGTEYWAQLREKGWDTAEFLGSFFSFESARRSLGMTFIANGRPFKDYFPSFAPPRPEKANFAHIFRTVVSVSSFGEFPLNLSTIMFP